jgi:hypothetical protein
MYLCYLLYCEVLLSEMFVIKVEEFETSGARRILAGRVNWRRPQSGFKTYIKCIRVMCYIATVWVA